MTTTASAPASGGPHGYSLPLSPSGQAAMLTRPPWHFSGEVTMVEYRADPEQVRRFLPPGLDVGADPGGAAAVFASWQWCSETKHELLDPAVNQFNEFLLLIGCEFDGEAMARCPFAWVDAPVPLVRGWVQGMPKQYGTVHLGRAVEVGRAGPRLVPGGRFAGTLSVAGRRVVEAAVTVEQLSAQSPPLHTVPLAHSLVTPQWVGPTSAPVLVASEVSDVEFGPVWTGPADLAFLDTLGPDLAELAPQEVGAGYRFSYAETLHGGRLLDGSGKPDDARC